MNTSDMTLEQMKSLYIRCSAIYHSGAGDESPLSDADFDTLKRAICNKALGQHWAPLNWAGWKPNDASPLQLVAHRGFMGSIYNAYDYAAKNEPEEQKWEIGFKTWLAANNGEVFATHKVDGVSVAIEYDNGQFKMALTRGDCVNGENVTHHVLLMRDVPTVIDLPCHMVIRGEVVMFASDWEQYRKLHPEAKNARNMTSGILGRKETGDSRFLRFIPHGLDMFNALPGLEPESFEQMYDMFKQLGFMVPANKICHTFDEAKQFHDEAETTRSTLPYEIDGVVYAINDRQAYFKAGIDSGSCPRGAVAWKFAALTGVSKLIGIEWTVGHLGDQNPTAKVDPVLIGGVTISSASLANMDEIERLNIAIGDTVIVSRRGDVIPKIENVIARPDDREIITVPTKCAACGGSVARRINTGGNTGVAIDCQNIACDAKASGKVGRWISSLDIKEVGDALLEELFKQGIVKTPTDLYRLNIEDLGFLKVNGRTFGKKNAEKVVSNIQATRTITIDQFIGSLGIRFLGKRRVELIRKAWIDRALGDVTFWFTASTGDSLLIAQAKTLGIPGIAEQLQKDLDAAKPMVDNLLNYITVINPPSEGKLAAEGPLAEKIFCLTGTMSRGRKDIAADIIKAGGQVKDDVATGVTLVQADVTSVSSKSKKANKLGCSIISEQDLMLLIK